MRRITRDREEGYVMITALIALAVMTILGAVAIAEATTALRISRQAVRTEQALYMANAGAEYIMARLHSETPPEEGTFYSDTYQLEPGLTGFFTVVATGLETETVQLQSTGTVQDQTGQTWTRAVLASIPLIPVATDPGGGGDPGGDPGGETGGGETEDPNAPVIFDQTMGSGGQVWVPNNGYICGDVVSRQRIELRNGVTVWGKTKFEDPNSPCLEVTGSGRVISAVDVWFQNESQVFVQGGWCDPDHWGEGTPCPTQPQADEIQVPTVDMAALKSRATEWWVRTEADCAGRPATTTCKVIPSNLLYLEGEMTFTQPALIWIDATLRMGTNDRLQITGKVNFVVNGQVQIANNARITCGEVFCPIAITSAQDISVGNGAEIHASMHAGTQFTGGNATIYGNVLAQTSNLDNNYEQHGTDPEPIEYPPGLPTNSGGYTTGNETNEPARPRVGGFSDWRQ